MKNKIEVIENLGISPKKPLYGGHYEVLKVKILGYVFFRRNKIKDNIITSTSYATEINAKKWESKYSEIIKQLSKKR